MWQTRENINKLMGSTFPHRQGEVEGCSPPRFGDDELSEKEGKEELSHPEGY